MAQKLCKLSPHDRAICPNCQGTGGFGYWEDVQGCEYCTQAQERGTPYCQHHLCNHCRGNGVVCPICCGMRFTRIPRASNGNDIAHCDCCEGNNVNPLTEMKLIQRHIRKLELSRQPGQPELEETQP